MDAFTSFLREHEDDRIYTVTPGGNHGDTLIHMGLVKKLEETGISYECWNLEEVYGERMVVGLKYLLNIAGWRLGVDPGLKLLDVPEDTDLILFEGGGYMNDVWYGPVLLRQALGRYRQPVAVAPQSYMFERTNLRGMLPDDRPITLFCRERYSLEHMSAIARLPNVRMDLSGDTALYIERRDLTELISPSDRAYDLICFRRDKESLIPRQEREQILKNSEDPFVGDISKRGSLSDFVSAVANAGRVYTDRLHVAILAHILGKETTLYGNRYHKNRGVYEYSLSQDPKVTFVDA